MTRLPNRFASIRVALAALCLTIFAAAVSAPAIAAESDPAVENTQRILTLLGYEPGPVDGQMGAKTRAALRAYQRDQGLEVTGTADVATYARLTGSGAGQAASRPRTTPATRATPANPAYAPQRPARQAQQTTPIRAYEPAARAPARRRPAPRVFDYGYFEFNLITGGAELESVVDTDVETFGALGLDFGWQAGLPIFFNLEIDILPMESKSRFVDDGLALVSSFGVGMPFADLMSLPPSLDVYAELEYEDVFFEFLDVEGDNDDYESGLRLNTGLRIRPIPQLEIAPRLGLGLVGAGGLNTLLDFSYILPGGRQHLMLSFDQRDYEIGEVDTEVSLIKLGYRITY